MQIGDTPPCSCCPVIDVQTKKFDQIIFSLISRRNVTVCQYNSYGIRSASKATQVEPKSMIKNFLYQKRNNGNELSIPKTASHHSTFYFSTWFCWLFIVSSLHAYNSGFQWVALSGGGFGDRRDPTPHHCDQMFIIIRVLREFRQIVDWWPHLRLASPSEKSWIRHWGSFLAMLENCPIAVSH